jgi:hypothetical protein
MLKYFGRKKMVKMLKNITPRLPKFLYLELREG